VWVIKFTNQYIWIQIVETVIANEVNEQLESAKSRTDITQHEIEALKTEINSPAASCLA
jgi:hypothetical protein